MLGNGDGTFQTASLFLSETYPYSAAAGDYNHDGKLDLAITFTSGIFSQGIVEILLGNGDGTFATAGSYSLMVASPYSIAAADLNHDGVLDFAATTFELAVAVLLGRGDGTFTAPVYYSTPYAAYAVAIADFNRDGSPDLAVGNFVLPTPPPLEIANAIPTVPPLRRLLEFLNFPQQKGAFLGRHSGLLQAHLWIGKDSPSLIQHKMSVSGSPTLPVWDLPQYAGERRPTGCAQPSSVGRPSQTTTQGCHQRAGTRTFSTRSNFYPAGSDVYVL